MYRQGDILIIRAELPAEAESLGHNILAKGEATGHAHVLEGDVQVYDNKGTLFFEVGSPTPLIHEEHETILIPEGTYQVIRQREYDEGEIRHVID